MRIGYGYDAHELVEGRSLIIGGVTIPYKKGLLGYSDGDVLSHAIIDALLGASGQGDIGMHFPAGNPEFKGISSLSLLKRVRVLLDSSGFSIGNIDATVVAEEPKLSPFIEEMKYSIALALGVSAQLVNVKGKREEGLGFTGEGKGVSASSVCLLHRKL